ncbi:MAG: PilT/PilU family type 4a pilus ATPase [Polyangiaceae bacterium]
MSDLGQLLREMVEANASDLFLAEGKPPAWRVDGAVSVTLHPTTSRDALETLMQNVLTPAQIELFRSKGDIDVGVGVDDLGRFRFHFHLYRGLIGAAVRAVPSGQLLFEELSLPSSLRSLAELPRGLILVTGATGSGKSTTLAAMIHHINRTCSKHIVTLEDPIEFVHEDLLSVVTQREVGSDTPDFTSGLRNVLRESPDVILVGEMRDAETMAIALSAAMTGHLVLSSLHTIDTTQTLQRVLSYFPEHMRGQVATDLSLSLQAIVAQRLVNRADERGRVPALELLLASPAIRRLIREQRVDEIVDAMAQDSAMETFDQSLVKLHQSGVISAEVGAANATHPDEFNLATHGLGRGAPIVGGEHDVRLPARLDIHKLLKVAIRANASDLHLIAGRPPMFRVNGELRPLDGVPELSPEMTRKLVLSLFNHAQRERFDLEHELDFAVTLTGGHRFRVNAHTQRGTTAAAIRLIPSVIPDVGTLGLPPLIPELALRQQGLVLVTGPTGSGKSTTLAAMIHLINVRRNCHIVTLEDPIEFVHENRLATIEQREIGIDSKSFAAALKYILRQDPDVILIGELRDTETIAAALTAAETGHLLLATLHSNDAPQTIDRIIDVFPPYQQSQIRVQLASELLAVIAQRLVPRADGSGRVAAFEVMIANTAVRRLIRDSKSFQITTTIETSAAEGMITLDKSLTNLVRAGVVTAEAAARHMHQPMK